MRIIDRTSDIGFVQISIDNKYKIKTDVDVQLSKRLDKLKQSAIGGNPMDIVKYNYELLESTRLKKRIENYLYHELENDENTREKSKR